MFNENYLMLHIVTPSILFICYTSYVQWPTPVSRPRDHRESYSENFQIKFKMISDAAEINLYLNSRTKVVSMHFARLEY